MNIPFFISSLSILYLLRSGGYLGTDFLPASMLVHAQNGTGRRFHLHRLGLDGELQDLRGKEMGKTNL